MLLLKNAKLVRFGKAIISVGLLLLLFRSISWSSLSAALQQARPSWFLFACAAAVGQVFLSAWRWQFLLRSLGVQSPSLSTLLYYYFVSGFFNNFAPANLAGDAVRIGSLFREGRDSVALTGSVVLERLLNLVGLAVICVWVVIAQPVRLSFRIKSWWIWVGAAALLGALAAGIWLWCYPPLRLVARLAQVRGLLVSAQSHYYELGQASIITTGLLFVMMLITFGSLQAMSVHLALSIHLAVYAVAGLALMIPLTIQGIGVREGVYVGLLGLVGVDPAHVLAALALNYIILLFLSILGGLLFWFGPQSLKS